MTVQQAIDEGYEHWMYSNGDFQMVQDLTDLLLDDSDYLWKKEIELVEKEPYHPAGIDAKDLLEQIGDQLQEQHSGESGDDTDNVSDAIKEIDHSILQPLIDEITKKLNGLKYYRGAGIILTKK